MRSFLSGSDETIQKHHVLMATVANFSDRNLKSGIVLFIIFCHKSNVRISADSITFQTLVHKRNSTWVYMLSQCWVPYNIMHCIMKEVEKVEKVFRTAVTQEECIGAAGTHV